MTDRTTPVPPVGPPPAPAAGGSRRSLRARAVIVLCAIGAVAAGVAASGTGYGYGPIPDTVSEVATPDAAEAAVAEIDQRTLERQRTTLVRRQRSLRTQLARTAPKGRYIVVDRTHNRLSLRAEDQTLMLAVCSAGSGARLQDPSGAREWTFSTPRGQFRVLSKIKNPVWRKPDWAFIEEGKPVPSNPADRLEYGALGEFALNFGNGYLIHGTLYERLLGRSVSHGCIRLGRDDLRTLYASTQVGTSIYIY